MVSIEYIKHDLSLAMELLTIGIFALTETRQKQVLMRAARNTLETLEKNIKIQEAGK